MDAFMSYCNTDGRSSASQSESTQASSRQRANQKARRHELVNVQLAARMIIINHKIRLTSTIYSQSIDR